MNETLLTCPDCGQPNILPRGLAAHRKSKHCAEARVERDLRGALLPAEGNAPGGRVPPVALKDLTVPQLGEAFRGLDAAQANYSKLSGICATMKGLVLAQVKGKLDHGKFQPWLKEHFPKSVRTASKFIRLADAFGKSEPTFRFESLTQDLLTTLEAAETAQIDLAHPLVASVSRWVGGRSAYQLELELVSPVDGRRANPGGFRPNLDDLRPWLAETFPEQREYLAVPFLDLPAEVRAKFLAEHTRYKCRITDAKRAELENEANARKWLVRAPAGFDQITTEKPFHYASDPELEALYQAATAMQEAIAMHRRDRQALRKGGVLK